MSSIHLECKGSRRQSLRPLTSRCPSPSLLYFLSDRDNILKVSGCWIAPDVAALRRDEPVTPSLRSVICRETWDESRSDSDVTLCVLSDTGSNVFFPVRLKKLVKVALLSGDPLKIQTVCQAHLRFCLSGSTSKRNSEPTHSTPTDHCQSPPCFSSARQLWRSLLCLLPRFGRKCDYGLF